MKSMLADIQSSLFEVQNHSASLNSMKSESQSEFRGLVQQHIEQIVHGSSQALEYKGNSYDLSQLKSIALPAFSTQDLETALPEGAEVQVPNSSVTLLPVTEVQIKQTVETLTDPKPLNITIAANPGEALPVTGKHLPPVTANNPASVVEASPGLSSNIAKQHFPTKADHIQLTTLKTAQVGSHPLEAPVGKLQPVIVTEGQVKAESQPVLAENAKIVTRLKPAPLTRNPVVNEASDLDAVKLPGKDKLETVIRDSLRPVNQQSTVVKTMRDLPVAADSRNPVANGSVSVEKQGLRLPGEHKLTRTGESTTSNRVKPVMASAKETTAVIAQRGAIQPTSIPASEARMVKGIRPSQMMQMNTDTTVTTSDPVKSEPAIMPYKAPQVLTLKAAASNAVELNSDGLKMSPEKSQVNLAQVARSEGAISESISADNTRAGQLLSNQTQQPVAVQTQTVAMNPMVTAPTANPVLTQSLPPLMNPQPHADALMLSKNADAAEWGKGLGERVSWMINQKLDSATIRIDPPSLGKLDVLVKVTDDITTITIQTQHAQTRDLVDASAHRLRDFMQESGFQNVNVDVSHRQDQQQARSQQNSLSENKSAENTLESDDAAEEETQQSFYSGDGLVDTFV
ncbi:MAG: flagellar hook-length control protein FliK [Pseudomonadota bacterium]